jgi:hypothetical protein
VRRSSLNPQQGWLSSTLPNGLNLLLTDGRIEIDNNTVERCMRPIALNRKTALLAGNYTGKKNWAMLASIIETCKLNKVEPHAYLTGVLTAIARGLKQKDIKQLLPWTLGSETPLTINLCIGSGYWHFCVVFRWYKLS